jgi:hypothetical protein
MSSIERSHKSGIDRGRVSIRDERERAEGRGDWIRTSDPTVPNRVLYQAEPHPDNVHLEGMK